MELLVLKFHDLDYLLLLDWILHQADQGVSYTNRLVDALSEMEFLERYLWVGPEGLHLCALYRFIKHLGSFHPCHRHELRKDSLEQILKVFIL